MRTGRIRAADIASVTLSPGSRRLLFRWLLRLEPADRVAELFTAADRDAPEWLVDWLYEQWQRRDRHDVEDLTCDGFAAPGGRPVPWNLRVASVTRNRAASAAMLDGFRREFVATGDPREWSDYLWDGSGELEEAAQADPAAFQPAAQALALPLPALKHLFDRDALLDRLEAGVRQGISAAVTDRAAATARAEAVRLLEDIPSGAGILRLMSLSRCPDIPHRQRRWLHSRVREAIWRRQPEQCARSIASRAQRPAEMGTDEARTLACLAEFPDADHLDFLWWAAATRGAPEARYLVVQALDGAETDVPRLLPFLRKSVQDGDSVVRFAAYAALSRRGLGDWAAQIEQVARQARTQFARAEALRWLADRNASRFLPTLRRGALRVSPNRDFPLLDAREAVMRLADQDTADACTALIQAALFGSGYAYHHLPGPPETASSHASYTGAHPYESWVNRWRHGRGYQPRWWQSF